MKRYRDVKLYDEDSQDLDKQMQEILEQRKIEAAMIAEAAISATDVVIEDMEDD
jgi:hypothetical protein